MNIENKIDRLEDAVAKFMKHQNAAIALLASEKMAGLKENIDAVAYLSAKDELLEVMDYGDQIAPKWTLDGTEYNPEMVLCHDADAELEDGEKIHGAYFEWKNTVSRVKLDAAEAIYYFNGTEGAGDHYIVTGAGFADWPSGLNVQITLSEAPSSGDQLFINALNGVNAYPIGRPWYIYAEGSTTVKQQGTVTEGNSGTCLGETNPISALSTNGNVNSLARVLYGYNRWSESNIRQWLNSDAPAGEWFTPLNPWDRVNNGDLNKPGFLYGYDPEIIKCFKAVKVVTRNNDSTKDTTFDRVFLPALSQYGLSIANDIVDEGEQWLYYKRLLGAKNLPFSATYTKLIRYSLTSGAASMHQFRSAASNNPTSLHTINQTGKGIDSVAISTCSCTPAVFISK